MKRVQQANISTSNGAAVQVEVDEKHVLDLLSYTFTHNKVKLFILNNIGKCIFQCLYNQRKTGQRGLLT